MKGGETLGSAGSSSISTWIGRPFVLLRSYSLLYLHSNGVSRWVWRLVNQGHGKVEFLTLPITESSWGSSDGVAEISAEMEVAGYAASGGMYSLFETLWGGQDSITSAIDIRGNEIPRRGDPLPCFDVLAQSRTI